MKDEKNTKTINKIRWYKRKLFITVIVLILLIIIFLSVFFGTKTNKKINDNDIYSKPNLSSYNLKDFNDDTQVNENVPKLNQKFEYGKQPIRGVNLGGWLVLEPFITPSLFDLDAKDEWTMCKKLGKTECQKKLTNHYDTFVSENDIKKIKDIGLDHVRIPLGYWALDINNQEPFVYGSFFYLLRTINWARKYGIRVMVEFHGAPGSQNGWNHSGKLGEVNFLNKTSTNNMENMKRFENIYLELIKFFSKKEWKNVVTLFGVLNEPAIHKTDFDFTLDFYKSIYNKTRTELKSDDPILIYHEGFIGLDKWEGKLPKEEYKNFILDSHNYLIFDKNLVRVPLEEQANIPCKSWKPTFEKSMANSGWTMCGEFSVATNDCGKWLNGVGLGARYEGTYQLEPGPAACNNCTCNGIDDYKNFTQEYKSFLMKFVQKQMSTFEFGLGWFFWNFKTEDNVNPHWDYFLGVDQGWIPKDARKRTYFCD